MASRSGPDAAGEFPIATIAAYGPDNVRATKLVVAIVRTREGREPHVTRTWTTNGTADLRTDAAVAAEIQAFISKHRVKHIADADRIIGCPHEEGIDYPMGRTCPRCPFWASINRFTHEPIAFPEPSMSADEVLAAIAADPMEIPDEALASADAHREALVAPLLEALARGIADPVGVSPEDAALFSYALYLLAKWREPRAYPYVIRWLSLPGEEAFEIGGDIVTQDGSRILAAVCDGNLDPIKELIQNRQANEYGRGAAVGALALLVAWAEMPRAAVVDYFFWLAREGLEREPCVVWDILAAETADIEALEMFPELRQLYEAGLIDPQFIAQSELDDVEAMPRGETLRETRERRPPIDDVAAATAWWDRRSRDFDDRDDSLDADAAREEDDSWDGDAGEHVVAEPYRAPPKVGRNEPCPCGSGKKFKKCCGR